MSVIAWMKKAMSNKGAYGVDGMNVVNFILSPDLLEAKIKGEPVCSTLLVTI